ncbi:MAG: DUF5081 family protein [Clostridium sp.]
MLSANEIYLLNECLGGSNIYGIDKDIALNENMLSERDVVESLREKKILNEDNTINGLSYLLIKNIEKFKKAKSYLWINDILLSEDETDFMVLMRKDSDSNGFDIKKTTNFNFMFSLLKEYEFLKGDDSGDKSIIAKISVDDFIEGYIKNLKNDEYIIGRREVNAKIPYVTSYVTYLAKDNKVYKYNVISGELFSISSKQARLEISNLLGLEVNKSE